MRCGACRAECVPPQPVCPQCGADDALERCALPATGRLYSFTIVHVPPEGREAESPYALGIVELEGGARITARIDTKDFGRLAIDMPLRLDRMEAGVFFFEPA
jgi:uncharacterized OB-fold protein